MCEVFEQAAFFGQQPVQHRPAVMLIARPDYEMVSPRYDADRIEWNEAQPTHDQQGIQFADGRCRQPLHVQPKPSRIAIVDFKRQRRVAFTPIILSVRLAGPGYSVKINAFVDKFLSLFWCSLAID